jgi:TatD DNase family protein
MLIDAHCHINCLGQDKISDLVLLDNHIFIDSSINYSSSLDSLKLSQQHKSIYSALGFHPFEAEGFSRETLNDYQALIDSKSKIVAIGEVGLDEKAKIPLEQQEKVFIAFIKLAKKNNLPLLIHNRLNSLRILEILDSNFTSYETIVFHCFSYSQDFLSKIVQKKGYTSFSLNILRKKPALLQALKACPLENLLLETDSPYMKIAGCDSTPMDIDKVYNFCSEVKGLAQSSLEEKVYSNAKRLFSL